MIAVPTSCQRNGRHPEGISTYGTRILGFDIDEMAREIAGLSLVLADPYNKNGWRIRDHDATQPSVSDLGQRPTIIATNPPFLEVKGRGERHELSSEIIARLVDLAADNGLLAVVTPQSLLESRAGEKTRKSIIGKCDLLEIDVLAGGLFYSGAETAVLLMRKRPKLQSQSMVSVATVREVRSRDVSAFRELGAFTRTYSVEPSLWREDRDMRFVLSPLSDIWRNLESHGRPLGSLAEVRNGLQVKTDDKRSVSIERRDGLSDLWIALMSCGHSRCSPVTHSGLSSGFAMVVIYVVAEMKRCSRLER